MKRIGIAVVATLTFAACGSSTSPTEPPSAPPLTTSAVGSDTAQKLATEMPFHKILCFGDSITYGVTLEALSLPPGAQADLSLVEGYVPKLWRLLESKYGAGYELTNAGVPGEGTSEGLDRLRTELSVHDPDLVLLLQGVIDVNGDNPRFGRVRSNLAEMMHLVRMQGREVIIGTYILLNPSGFRTDGASNVPLLNEIIREEAGKQSVHVADHERAVDLSGQGPDGLHPNNIGYEAMARTWLEAMEAVAESMGPT